MDAIEKVLNLPNIVENIVANIFPRRQRREIMLVSKVFRDAVYKLEEPTCKMIIYEKTLNDNLMIESMINSKRRIHHVEISIMFNDLNLHTVADIFQERGDQIQTLKGTFYSIDQQSMNARVFLKLMKNFPNVKKLELLFYGIHIVNWMSCEHILGLNGMIDLELDVLECNLGHEFAQIFAPNSIEELKIKCQLDLFEDLMKSQSSITSLRISEELLKPELLKALTLEYFEIIWSTHNEEASNALLEQLVRDHPELKQLNFYFPMSPALLTALCKKSNLESLSLIVDNRNIHHFQQLANLPKSTQVRLYLGSFSQEDEFIQVTLTPLHNIERMEIDINKDVEEVPLNASPISEAFFENMGRNWPNIKKLKMSGKRVLINNVLEHLENLQMLEIDLTESDLRLHHNSSTYPHMTSLIIHQVKEVLNLPDLLKKMPNLKKLSFNGGSSPSTLYSDYLLVLLDKMESLEVLKIDFKIMSAKAIASENEIKMLKKLCSKLKEFSISFKQSVGNFPFNNQVYEELKYCNMEMSFTNGESTLILQKNAKF